MQSTARLPFAAIALLLSARIAVAQTDHGPRPHVDSTLLRFPDVLRSAHVGGSARASLTIDSAGRLIRSSLRITDARHDLFANALKAALVGMTFDAATRGGRPVESSLEIDAEFHIPDPYYVPRVPTWQVDSIAGGYRIITGWDAIPRAQPAPALSDADDRAVRKAVLDALRRMSDPSPGERLEPAKLTPWTANVVSFEGRTWDPRSGGSWGASGRTIWCQISRTGPTAPWIAQCEQTGAWVSSRMSDHARPHLSPPSFHP